MDAEAVAFFACAGSSLALARVAAVEYLHREALLHRACAVLFNLVAVESVAGWLAAYACAGALFAFWTWRRWTTMKDPLASRVLLVVGAIVAWPVLGAGELVIRYFKRLRDAIAAWRADVIDDEDSDEVTS